MSMIAMKLRAGTLDRMVTNTGDKLSSLSEREPIMLVFLRHFGCTFCREALADLAAQQKAIEELGVRIVFIHMTEPAVAERYFHRYGIQDPVHVSDPACQFYASFGLVKGTVTQLFGLQSWIRGFQAGIMDGHGVGAMLGDGFQMPGVFVVYKSDVKQSFIHRLASDRPNYLEMAEDCTLPG